MNWLSNCTAARYYVPMFVSVCYLFVQVQGTMFQCLCQSVIQLYRCTALCHLVIQLYRYVRHYVPMFVSIFYPIVQMHGTMFQCLCQLVMYLYMCTVLCSTVCVSWLPNCTDAWHYVPVFVSIGYSIVEMYSTMFQCLC